MGEAAWAGPFTPRGRPLGVASPLLCGWAIQALTFARDVKRVLTLCQNLGGVELFYFGLYFHTLPSFPAYMVARITEALVSGCHLRDREAMPSPRGIVGMYPLGPRGPRLPHQAPAAHRSCRFLSRRILCGTSPELGGHGPWGALGICFRLSQALPKGLLVLGRAVKHLPVQGNVCSWVKKAASSDHSFSLPRHGPLT